MTDTPGGLPVEVALIVTAVLAAVFAVVKLFGMLRRALEAAYRFVHRIQDFLDDWTGRPADPVRGLDAQPGAMARIKNTEHEVTYNGGGSVKDALRRVELKVGALRDVADELATRADTNAGNIDAIRISQAEAKDLAEGARDAAAAVAQAFVDHEDQGREFLADAVRQLQQQGITLNLVQPPRPADSRERSGDEADE